MKLIYLFLFLVGYLTSTLSAESQAKAPKPTQRKAVINGDERDCDPDTGLCQDSSCTVFGYLDSARSNCHTSGEKPNCQSIYCDWAVPDCSETSNGTHCYGFVKCRDGGKSCCADDGQNCNDYGAPCLQDGNSFNFKVCNSGECRKDSDCEGEGMVCRKKGKDKTCTDDMSVDAGEVQAEEVQAAGFSCQECQDIYKGKQCLALEKDQAGALTTSVPDCDFDKLVGFLNSNTDYGCKVPLSECDTIVCSGYIPDGVLQAAFQACRPRFL